MSQFGATHRRDTHWLMAAFGTGNNLSPYFRTAGDRLHWNGFVTLTRMTVTPVIYKILATCEDELVFHKNSPVQIFCESGLLEQSGVKKQSSRSAFLLPEIRQ
ncbi:MAG TPA: hypothetical protein VGN40_08095 [Lelliottia sp.]|jgi:hypothetical protein